MRILFIIVDVLGLVLTGLGAYEFHAASENDSIISEIEQQLMPPYQVIDGHKVSMMYNVLWPSDFDAELKTSSLAVVSAGVVLFVIGVIGITKSGKMATPEAASEPN